MATKLYPARVHRDKLFHLLPPKAVVYLQGDTVRQRHTTDRDLPWRQESNFFYLSGLEVPGSSLVASEDKIHLFVPPLDKDAVMWMGLPPTLEHLRATHDVDSISTTDEISSLLDTLLSSEAASTLYVLPHQVPPTSHAKVPVDNKALLMALETARLSKTPFEIELLKQANNVSSAAHAEVQKGVAQGLFKAEYQVAAYFQYKCAAEGSTNLAYESIAAYGPASATLHYVDLNQKFNLGQGELLLLDAGCEISNYAADITRTFPVGNGGRFTKHGREIYALVLKMQTEALERIKAGASWKAIHLHMHRLVIQGLLELGLLIAGPSKNTGKLLEDELYEKNLSVPFYPHGLGHNLGLDVHDCPIGGRPDGPDADPKLRYLRIGLDLIENQVITVEPGVYCNPFLLAEHKESPYINHELLKEYMKVGGVRIEDNVIVTKTGYIPLTTAPKSIEEVEKLTSGAV